MMTTRALTRLVLCCWAFGLLSTARAEEIPWRTDYNAARKEASDKNRPLIIDFGHENCLWCKKLDSTTFQDPAVAKLVSERFVALRVDVMQTPVLAEKLHIQSYPTLVFASADGHILGIKEGYLEAPELVERLQKVLAPAAPDWMARDYQEAQRAIDKSDFTLALMLLRKVVEDGKARPVQVRSRQLLQDLEQQAAARYEQARQLAEKGEVTEAVKTMQDLVTSYPGTRASRQGGKMLVTLVSRNVSVDQQRSKRAQDLLAQAREDYGAKQFLGCMDRCEMLIAGFADLPEATEATQLIAEIKANPEYTKQVCDQLGDRLSVLYLSLAETWLKKGQPQQAVFYLERVVQNFPNTRHAETAQVRLAQIQGAPPRSTETPKKP